ncbi:restriction endonuclease S subunit [Staphylococcus cohnii]|nr:restriction endonuclease subunit S [Staphylococcus cohnii]SUN25573.1 restriction endonuclease S subunit [Staphylococcus cohnii]
MTNEVKNVPELRFPGFEDEWKEKKLGTIFTVTMGQSPNSTNYTDNPNDTILVQGNADIYKGKIWPRIYTKEITKLLERNDIILSVRAPVGEIGIAQVEACIGRGVCSIKGNKFLYYFLDLFKKQNRWSRFSQGSTFESISGKDIRDLKFYVCNSEEQNKIGEFFNKLDRQIELEEEKLELLEQQKKGYMQKIFSQELGFKDENGNEYPTWQSYKLGNLYKKGKAGGTPKSTESKYYNGEVPFLSISDITEQGKFIMNTEKSITQEGVDNSTAWLVPVNSINYAMYASVGYLSINKIEVATSQAIFNMVFEDNNLVEYIYYYLNHIRDKGILEKLVGTGTQSNLSASIMKNMYIKLPDYEEMVKITDFLSKVDKLIEKQNQKIDRLKEHKKGFLQKMFI